MKKSSSNRSQLYSPKRKPNFWTEGFHTTLNILRHPVIIIGVIIVILYLTRFTGGGKTITRLRTSSDRDVIVLNLDDVQATTCAKYAQLMNFTTEEYQVR